MQTDAMMYFNSFNAGQNRPVRQPLAAQTHNLPPSRAMVERSFSDDGCIFDLSVPSSPSLPPERQLGGPPPLTLARPALTYELPKLSSDPHLIHQKAADHLGLTLSITLCNRPKTFDPRGERSEGAQIVRIQELHNRYSVWSSELPKCYAALQRELIRQKSFALSVLCGAKLVPLDISRADMLKKIDELLAALT